MCLFAPHAPACVAAHDTPLIGERAATRGRIATEGVDEHSLVKRRYPFARQPRERNVRRELEIGGRSTD